MSSGTGLRIRGSRAARPGEDVILDIDYQGASRSPKTPISTAVAQHLHLSPSFDHLEQRLRDRGLNSEDEIQTRLQKAVDESTPGKSFTTTSSSTMS